MNFLSFLINKSNIFISAAAVFSGAMLLIPSFRKGGSGLTAAQAITMANQQHAVWVDIRPTKQFKNGHIAQAHNVPTAELEAKASSLPKNKPLIIVCATGHDASRAVSTLRAQGFSNVVLMVGGMRAWADASLPVIQK